MLVGERDEIEFEELDRAGEAWSGLGAGAAAAARRGRQKSYKLQ
jgi:hypothetical protein